MTTNNDGNATYVEADIDQAQTDSAVDESPSQPVKERINAGQIRKSTTQNLLRAAQNATGLEFNSVEDLISTLAELKTMTTRQSQAQPTSTAQHDENQQQQQPDGTRRPRVTGNDLQEQIQALKREMDLKEQRLRERELDSNIRSSLNDRFDPEFMDYTINRVKSQLVEQDGEWIVVNAKNQQRYNTAGEPMSVKELVDELAQSNPKLLRQQPQTTGSGLRPRQGFEGLPGDDEQIPDYTRDPAAFNAWAAKRGLGKNQGLKAVTASVSNSTQVRKIM
jgi:hypothetical protein